MQKNEQRNASGQLEESMSSSRGSGQETKQWTTTGLPRPTRAQASDTIPTLSVALDEIEQARRLGRSTGGRPVPSTHRSNSPSTIPMHNRDIENDNSMAGPVKNRRSNSQRTRAQDLEDEEEDRSYSLTRFSQSPSPTPPPPQRSSQPSPAGSVRTVYPYSNNKNIVSYQYRDPQTSVATTMTRLDTRSGIDQTSALSQVRQRADQKAWERQMEIQRDMAAQRTLAREFNGGSSQNSDTGERQSRSRQGQQQRDSIEQLGEDEDQVESWQEAEGSKKGARKSIPSSWMDNHHDQYPAALPQQNGSIPGGTASRPVFIENPHRFAPTPSPDVSSDLVRHVSRRSEMSALRQYDQIWNKNYQRIQHHNQLLEQVLEHLKSAEQIQGQNGVDGGNADAYSEGDEEDQEWEQMQLELDQIRQQLEETLTRQKSLEGELGRANELNGIQAQDLERVQEMAKQDNDQWQQRLEEETTKQEESHTAKEERLLKSARLDADEAARQLTLEKEEKQKMDSYIQSLKRLVEDLEGQLHLQSTKARSTISTNDALLRQEQGRVRELEKALGDQREIQENAADIQAQADIDIDELTQKLRENEEVVNALEAELAQSRNREKGHVRRTEEAVDLARQQYERGQEEHFRELTELQQEMGQWQRQLADSQREMRIKDTAIHQLRTELEQKAAQLARANSLSSSTAVATQKAEGMIEELQDQLQRQDQEMMERESRIKALEQEVEDVHADEAGLVSEMEQKLAESETERIRLTEVLRNAHVQVEKEKRTARDLEANLQRQTQDLESEMFNRQEGLYQLLERILDELTSVQSGQPLGGDDLRRVSVEEIYLQFQARTRVILDEYAELHDVIENQRQELDEFVSKTEGLEDEMRSDKEQLEELQDKLGLAEEHIVQLEIENERFQREEPTLLHAYQEELDMLRKQVDQLEQNRQHQEELMQQQQKEAKTRNDKFREEAKVRENELNRLRRTERKREESLAELLSRVDEAKRETATESKNVGVGGGAT
ncbi:hypothetical protein BGW38_003281 [Lunasporangiospora selenospora]|uniref:Uncharacterized protein n=1 Tax=Lunasporangiospora selenospora TaxID=979761 RepID=A0A9P6KCT5_9FUNG|nr:hypothetical protein BGW38_003281 [Lunasporangiospora selenospora]